MNIIPADQELRIEGLYPTKEWEPQYPEPVWKTWIVSPDIESARTSRLAALDITKKHPKSTYLPLDFRIVVAVTIKELIED